MYLYYGFDKGYDYLTKYPGELPEYIYWKIDGYIPVGNYFMWGFQIGGNLYDFYGISQTGFGATS